MTQTAPRGTLECMDDIRISDGEHLQCSVRGDVRIYVAAGASVTALPETDGTLNIRLEGRGARAEVRCAVRLSGEQTRRHIVCVVHAAPDTVSRQVFRCVASDAARCNVESDVRIERGATGSDSRQDLRGLVLTPGARHDLKPSLAVFEDDLKACSHGATTGALESAHVRYLRMRGMDEAEAKTLLIEAFLQAAA